MKRLDCPRQLTVTDTETLASDSGCRGEAMKVCRKSQEDTHSTDLHSEALGLCSAHKSHCLKQSYE